MEREMMNTDPDELKELFEREQDLYEKINTQKNPTEKIKLEYELDALRRDINLFLNRIY